MRTIRETPPQGARRHLFCAAEALGVSTPVAFEALLPKNRSDDPDGIFSAAQTIVEEILPILAGASCEKVTLNKLSVIGYLAEIGSPYETPTVHVGSPGIRSETCDFCSAKPVVGTLEPEPTPFWRFVTDAPGIAPIFYQGPWTYCLSCKPLVEAKDHLALARRAMSARPPQEPDPERRRRHFEGLYQQIIQGGSP